MVNDILRTVFGMLLSYVVVDVDLWGKCHFGMVGSGVLGANSRVGDGCECFSVTD